MLRHGVEEPIQRVELALSSDDRYGLRGHRYSLTSFDPIPPANKITAHLRRDY